MIVPARRVPVAAAALRPGDKHRVDSGMGGSFPVEYVGPAAGRHVFRNLDREFRRTCPTFTYPADAVSAEVFDLAPAAGY